MRSEYTEYCCRFQRLGSREVVADIESGTVSSDGSMLLRQVEETFSLIDQSADCFTDRRHPARIAHNLKELLAQRILPLPGLTARGKCAVKRRGFSVGESPIRQFNRCNRKKSQQEGR